VRELEITLYLRDELLRHIMNRRAYGLLFAPSDHFFGTSTGRLRDPDRFRDRILARAVDRANSNRVATRIWPNLRTILRGFSPRRPSWV